MLCGDRCGPLCVHVPYPRAFSFPGTVCSPEMFYLSAAADHHPHDHQHAFEPFAGVAFDTVSGTFASNWIVLLPRFINVLDSALATRIALLFGPSRIGTRFTPASIRI